MARSLTDHEINVLFGINQEKRMCKKCQRLRLTSAFYVFNRSTCMDCVKARAVAWKRKNRGKKK